ncbi:hypothetical protein GCM10017744_002650 [Streptomyces antimycoticus]|uniref:Uncharacterized protein n=1 Tax=Streptomyces antimycoticus TaxID=68175 RepID=A0A4D4KQY1_9ACTN|nr:hypothetical protein SANT12839_096990 [Streptomyces antimycoticus]
MLHIYSPTAQRALVIASAVDAWAPNAARHTTRASVMATVDAPPASPQFTKAPFTQITADPTSRKPNTLRDQAIT